MKNCLLLIFFLCKLVDSLNTSDLTEATKAIVGTYESFIDSKGQWITSTPVKVVGRGIHDLLISSGEAIFGSDPPYPLRTVENASLFYDYIIVGGGTAGSVLALRLSENPSKSILVLEAGGLESRFSVLPFASIGLMKSKTDWMFQSVPQKHSSFGLENRQIPVPQGKVVGGSSSHNQMIYMRGCREDYDNWEKLGAKDWSFKDVLPYFKKSETRIKDSYFEKEYHGYKGPLPVTKVNPSFKTDVQAMKAAIEIGLEIGDYNGKSQNRRNFADLHSFGGERFSAARSYLQEASFRPNVDVVINAFVTRILFNERRTAVGVIYEKGNSILTAYANKEVIVSAGPYNSPKLLLLSGIGPKETLKKFGIPVIVDSPGVGQNLQDHPYFLLPYTAKPGSSLSVFNIPKLVETIEEYLVNRTGFFASPGAALDGSTRTPAALDKRPDIGMPVSSVLPSLSPLAGYLQNYQDSLTLNYFLPNDLKEGFLFQIVNFRPFSRGYVSLYSADPYDNPLIDFRLLSDKRDLESLVQGCLLAQKLGNTSALFVELEARPFQNTVPGCEKYPYYSEAFCACFASFSTMTQYHGSGTVRMGSKDDPMAVLDPKLRVKGVKNLRVADSSIMPEVVTATTSAPSMMIGEKSADIIKGIVKNY
ncbi:alcohol dehydrogenase [acceptor]-like [Brevipalpus obovatus]|uniref:alcohol dehydrogenase [acceptor]-like n=1 Tax=Brevipalpus obovatus TaxID=246614 RepID=UPI003D9FA5A1